MNVPCRHINAVALPLVLWGIAFLAGLVVMASVRVAEHVEQEGRDERGFQARQFALRGIAIGMHPEIKEADPLLNQFSEETDEGYRVVIKDEAGRINPNAWIPQGERDLFHRLFASWDISLTEADAEIDSLSDWIDEDDLRMLAGAEGPEYAADGREGLPANAPLESVREMEAVMNLGNILSNQPEWRDLFTVWRRGKINVNHAEAPVLQLVGGLDGIAISTILEFRAGQDGIDGTEDDGEFSSVDEVIALTGLQGADAENLSRYFQTSGSMRRVESTGYCNGIERTIIAVIDGRGRIRAWEEG